MRNGEAPPPGPSRYAPLGAVLVIIAVVGAALLREAPNEAVVPMGLFRERWPAATFSLTATPLDGQSGNGFRTPLNVADLATAAAADRIDLMVATFDVPVRVARARIEVPGWPCTFDAAPGAPLADNSYLSLFRSSPCPPLPGARDGLFILTLQTEAPAAIALWVVTPPREANGAIPATAPGPVPRFGEAWVVGRYATRREGPGPRFAALIGFLWNAPLPGPWVWVAVTGLAAALLAGAAVTGRASSRAGQCAAAALVTAGLGGIYAILSPPLHGPDEPTHFVSYATVSGQPQLQAELDAWHLRGHVQRLRRHSDQRFRPADREQPSAERWADVAPSRDYQGNLLDYRSPAAAWYWRFTGSLLGDGPASRQLLMLRLLNAVWFGCAMGAAVAIAGLRPGAGLTIAAPMILTAPALPFFGMHVSNHAMLAGIYLVATGAILRIVCTGRASPVAGLTLGLAAGLGVLTSRSALPMAAIWSSLLLIRLAAPAAAADTRGRLGGAVRFWIATIAPIAAGAALVSSSYLNGLDFYIVRRGIDYPLTNRVLVIAAILAGVVAVAIELAAAALLNRLGAGAKAAARRAVLFAGAACAVLLAALVIAPRVVAIEPLRQFEPSGARQFALDNPLPGQYVAAVWAAALGLFGSYPPDFLLSASFWGGFGWLDALPPFWLMSGLAMLLGVLLSWSTLRVVWHGDAARVLAALLLFAGLALTLSAYAALSAITNDYLHGRYLIGWYLALAAPAVAGVAQAAGVRPAVGVVVWTVFTIAHSVSIWTLLNRYFGP